MELIVEMIRDGRLILRDNPNMSYECERCGKPTQSGRYCASCTQELVAGLGSAAADLQKQKEATKTNDRGGYYSKS